MTKSIHLLSFIAIYISPQQKLRAQTTADHQMTTMERYAQHDSLAAAARKAGDWATYKSHVVVLDSILNGHPNVRVAMARLDAHLGELAAAVAAPTILRRRYDSFVYIEETKAVDSLHLAVLVDGEPPETSRVEKDFVSGVTDLRSRLMSLKTPSVVDLQAQSLQLHRFVSVALAALAIACDHSPDASLVMTEPNRPAPVTAGSFELNAACATILESASGGIVTFRKPSILTLAVDSRKADGTIAWSKTLPSGSNTCVAAVAASNNLVVAASDSVFSLNGQTGAIRWRFASHVIRGIAASSTGRIFLSQNAFSEVPATLYALSDADGSVLWAKVVDDPGAPFVDDTRSTVYQVRRAGAAAMDLATGNLKWQTPLGSDLTTDAAIASDGTILVARSNDFYGEITAYGTDGTRVWRNSGFAARQIRGSPVIDDAGTVYAATRLFDGAAVYALSTTTGETKWSHQFFHVESNVAVDANRTVYVIAQATADTGLKLYGLRDGVIVFETAARDPTFDGLITIHSNHLLYYAAGNTVFFVPTAGVSLSAPWPLDRHDAKRSGHR